MKEMIKSMTRLLEQEREICAQILRLSEDKRALIIDEDIGALDRLVQKETTLLEQLALLEKNRKARVGVLAEALHVKTESLHISSLVELTDDADVKKKLLTVKAELDQLLQKQVHCNNLIKKLLEAKKRYAEVMLGAWAQSGSLSNTYGYDGTVDSGERGAGLFDRQI